MIKRLLLLAGLCASSSAYAQTPIATARTMSAGATVSVKGIATNGSELGTIRYIQDATGGLALYGNNLSSIQRGDSVTATGTVSPYNNLFELASVTFSTSAGTLPTPELVTITNGYNEAHEGELVRINGVSFTASGTFTGNNNYVISDGVNTAEIRITDGSNLVNTPIPAGPIDLVGIMSQFCPPINGTGCTTGYQLLPRDINDILFSGAPPVLTTGLMQSNVTTSSFTVSFNTQNNGNTIVRYGLTAGNLNQTATDNAQTTTHSVNLTGLQAGTIYFVQGIAVSASDDTSFSSIQPMATVSLSSGTIKPYFNRPVNNSFSTGTNAVFLDQQFDDTLKAYLDRAEQTIDIAIYNLDNANGIVDAINLAASQGVTVRVICDEGVSSGVFNSFINSVNKIKSPVDNDPYGIMHNKMVIIDANHADPNKPIYWTGSTNMTDQQINVDANDIIIFQDQSIARAATLEFNEMFGSAGNTPNPGNAKFGPFKSDNTPHEFVVGGKRVQMYFSPSEAVNQKVMQAFATANNSIHYAIFAFTRNDIANAIKNAYNAGATTVQGMADDTANGSNAFDIIASAVGVSNLKVYNENYSLHHKYAIVDVFDTGSDPLVITGSYNWSSSGTFDNDENIVIVHDATIANIYFQAWAQRFQDAGGTVITETNEVTKATSTVLLFPNPTSNLLHVTYKIDGNDKPIFTMFDLTGRVVKSWTAQSTNGSETIDAGELANGLYLLNVSTNTFNRTVRFDKQ